MTLPVLNSSPTEPWYADGLSFTCTQCGNCCTGSPGYVWISEIEIQRLAAHLNISTHDVVEQYCRRIGNRISLRENRAPSGNYDCVFLKEVEVPAKAGQAPTLRRTCTIYSVRPLQCRTWPFWDGLLDSAEDWKRASRKCPGMNTGKKYSLANIEKLRTATDWPK
jgi:Fe-S-cluster containining protein